MRHLGNAKLGPHQCLYGSHLIRFRFRLEREASEKSLTERNFVEPPLKREVHTAAARTSRSTELERLHNDDIAPRQRRLPLTLAQDVLRASCVTV
jgi:hypothetical protein